MLRSTLKHTLRRLPAPWQSRIRSRVLRLRNRWEVSSLNPDGDRGRWIRDVYTAKQVNDRTSLLVQTARYHWINRLPDGHYLEFGSHKANTMRQAWDTFRPLWPERTYVAFDSFEGLPEPAPDDRQGELWTAGKLATSEAEFRRVCIGHGLSPDRLITIPGFYSDTLRDHRTYERIPEGSAAMVYVDCDLYSSTVDVLQFVVPLLRRGTVIAFDDWLLYDADPGKGQKRAWREFCADHPDLRFEAFVSVGDLASFICL